MCMREGAGKERVTLANVAWRQFNTAPGTGERTDTPSVPPFHLQYLAPAAHKN